MERQYLYCPSATNGLSSSNVYYHDNKLFVYCTPIIPNILINCNSKLYKKETDFSASPLNNNIV